MDKKTDSYYTDQKINPDAGETQSIMPEDNHRHWEYVRPGEPVRWDSWSGGIPFDEGGTTVPEPIRHLMEMFRQEPWLLTRKKSFYEQALYMVDYEDNVEIVPFFEYFPVYRSMNIPQLRSYFTFRTLARNGEFPGVPLSYIFVYVYEILMQIHVPRPAVGLEMLEKIMDAYAEVRPKLIKYLELWMRDYIVYYGLNDKITDYFTQEKKGDALAAVLKDYQTDEDGLLFETVSSLSDYKIKTGVLFKKHPGDLTAVVCRAIRATVPIYEQRYDRGIDELCLGVRRQSAHPMFVSAMFYLPDPVKEGVFEISLRRRYYCKGGLWTMDTFKEEVLSKKGAFFGKILHETDRRLRISLRIKSKMVASMSDNEMESAIQKEIDQYLKDREEEARPKIKVDFSKLGRIRADADVVRDALLSGEEDTVTSSPLKETSKVDIKVEPEKDEKKDSPFTRQEQIFLHMLVEGGDWKSYLRTIHVPIGVMTDNINEKMMDDLQDTVITDDGSGPRIMEDYLEDIVKKI